MTPVTYSALAEPLLQRSIRLSERRNPAILTGIDKPRLRHSCTGKPYPNDPQRDAGSFGEYVGGQFALAA